MHKFYRSLLPALLLCAAALIPGVAMTGNDLDPILRPYLSRYGLPAVAAAVVKDGKTVAAGAVGTRRTGTDIPVTVHDRFHIGSDTKAMTALLAAMIVEGGKLRWNSTLAEIYPEFADKMEPWVRSITVEQLLSHTGGVPGDNEKIFALYGEALSQNGNLDELRHWLVREWSTRTREPRSEVKFAYSNLGYTIMGNAIERAAGKTWDELIVERIFIPLELKTAGLGPQTSLGRIDAPLGHVSIDGKPKAILAGPNADAPPLVGPAGIVHMSVLDFALWAGWNAGEGKRGPALVSAENLRKLHTPAIMMPVKKDAPPGTPPGGGYACGWGELPVSWAPYPLTFHGGSNMMNLAHIWLDTKKDFAMVIMANIGGPKADEAFRHLAEELHKKFATK